MWKLVGDLAKRIAFLVQDTQKNKADIKELQERMQDLIEELREMRFENRRDRENAAHEHEKLLLRLEVTLLRAERRTLTGKNDPPLLLEETDKDA